MVTFYYEGQTTSGAVSVISLSRKRSGVALELSPFRPDGQTDRETACSSFLSPPADLVEDGHVFRWASKTLLNECARRDDITYGAGCRDVSRSVGLRAGQDRDSGPEALQSQCRAWGTQVVGLITQSPCPRSDSEISAVRGNIARVVSNYVVFVSVHIFWRWQFFFYLTWRWRNRIYSPSWWKQVEQL